jgi:hypothetical protein
MNVLRFVFMVPVMHVPYGTGRSLKVNPVGPDNQPKSTSTGAARSGRAHVIRSSSDCGWGPDHLAWSL